MIPKDPFMLMSYINTQLRDHYSSLEDLCASLGIDQENIEQSLQKIGFVYSSQLNKFVNK